MLSNCCHLKQYTNSGTDEMFISFINNNNNNNLDLYRSSKDEWKKKTVYFRFTKVQNVLKHGNINITWRGVVCFFCLFCVCVGGELID